MESDRSPLIKLHINVIIGFWSTLVYIGIFVSSFIRDCRDEGSRSVRRVRTLSP